MKYKKTLAVVISLVIAYFVAYPVGRWFDSKYASGGWLFFGPFPGYLAGYFLSYVFISSMVVSIFAGRVKYGFYATLPVLIIDILLGAFNPQLWMDLILLTAGLGLAWIILSIKTEIQKAR